MFLERASSSMSTKKVLVMFFAAKAREATLSGAPGRTIFLDFRTVPQS